MAERIMVYARLPVKLDPAAMRQEIDTADPWTLAEASPLPEGEDTAVEAVRPHLRFEQEHGNDGRSWVWLHWKAHGRPIRIESSPVLAEEIAEILDELPATPAATEIRDHLQGCRFAVEFELGIDDAQHLAALLSEVLAFWAAEAGDGLVRFYQREWVSPHDRGRAILRTK